MRMKYKFKKFQQKFDENAINIYNKIIYAYKCLSKECIVSTE